MATKTAVSEFDDLFGLNKPDQEPDSAVAEFDSLFGLEPKPKPAAATAAAPFDLTDTMSGAADLRAFSAPPDRSNLPPDRLAAMMDQEAAMAAAKQSAASGQTPLVPPVVVGEAIKPRTDVEAVESVLGAMPKPGSMSPEEAQVVNAPQPLPRDLQGSVMAKGKMSTEPATFGSMVQQAKKDILPRQPGTAAWIGLQNSISGLIGRAIAGGTYESAAEQQYDPAILDKAIEGVGALAADPATTGMFIGGAVPGAIAGKIVAETLAKRLGPQVALRAIQSARAVGGGATSFAIYDSATEALRQAAKREFDLPKIAEAGKHGLLVGGAMGAAGAATMGGPGLLKLAGEVGVLASVPPALEGRAPTVDDWIDAGVLIGSLKGAHKVKDFAKRALGKPRAERTPVEQQIVQNLPPEVKKAIADEALKTASELALERAKKPAEPEPEGVEPEAPKAAPSALEAGLERRGVEPVEKPDLAKLAQAAKVMTEAKPEVEPEPTPEGSLQTAVEKVGGKAQEPELPQERQQRERSQFEQAVEGADQESRAELYRTVPATFGEFVQARGKRWPISVTDPGYMELRRQYDEIKKPIYEVQGPRLGQWQIFNRITGEVEATAPSRVFAQMEANRLDQARYQPEKGGTRFEVPPSPVVKPVERQEREAREQAQMRQAVEAAPEPESAVKPEQPAEAPVVEAQPTPKVDEGGPHEFSSTQVDLPPRLAIVLKNLGARIPNAALAEGGREARPHVTVRFGLHTPESAPVEQALQGEGPIRVRLGKLGVFKSPEHDVLYAEVESPDLVRLNEKLGALPNTQTHPEYKPHATIAYLKPGQGDKYVGGTQLAGQEATLDTVAFSPKAGGQPSAIKLTRAAGRPAPAPSVPRAAPRQNLPPRGRLEPLPQQRAPEPLGQDRGVFDASDIDQVMKFVRARGGIAPSPSGDLTGEYQVIPPSFKNKRGLTPEKMAEALSEVAGRDIGDAELLVMLAGGKTAQSLKSQRAKIEERAPERAADRQAEADELAALPDDIKARRIAQMTGMSEADAFRMVERQKAEAPPTEAAEKNADELQRAARDYFEVSPDEPAAPEILDRPHFKEFGGAERVIQDYFGGDRERAASTLEAARQDVLEGRVNEEPTPYGMRTETTPEGEQGLIEGASRRAIPTTKTRATVPQKPVQDTPLFTKREQEGEQERLPGVGEESAPYGGGVPADPKAEIERLGMRYDGASEGPKGETLHWFTDPKTMSTGLVEPTPEGWAEFRREHGGETAASGQIEEPRAPYAPTFFSGLQKIVNDKMPEAAPAAMVQNIVKQAKPEEVKWTGIDDFLRARGGARVTKQEVQDFLKQNEVRVEEVAKGAPPEILTELPAEYRVEPVDLSEGDKGFRLKEEYDRVVDRLTEKYNNLSDAEKAEVEQLDNQFQNYTVRFGGRGPLRRGGRGRRTVNLNATLPHPDLPEDPMPLIRWARSVLPESFPEELTAGRGYVVIGPARTVSTIAGPRTSNRRFPQGNTEAEATANALAAINEPLSGVNQPKFARYTLPGGPLSRDTEILTDHGWKRMDAVMVGDVVMTRRDDSGLLEWKPVDAIPTVYADTLYHFRNQSIDMMVTAGHQMVVKRRRRSKAGEFRVTAEELWRMSECVVPLTGVWDGGVDLAKFFGLDAGDVAEFIGWFLSEGSRVKSRSGHRSTIAIAQCRTTNPDKCARLEALFGRLGMKWNYAGTSYYVGIKSVPAELRWLLDEQGAAAEKFIPPMFFGLSRRLIGRLLESLLLGDGSLKRQSRRKPAWTFFTLSSRLADGVQALALMTGQRASVHRRKTGLYAVRLLSKRFASVDDAKHGVVEYHDTAFCVTVKNHAIYVRRNGVAAFTGNSNYRELLLTLPEKAGAPAELRKVKAEIARKYGENWEWDDLAPEDQARLDAFRGKEGIDMAYGPGRAPYRSPHWDEPNVLAHVRFNDRTDNEGRRVLFIEEIQSDWHQEGRRKGYAGPPEPVTWNEVSPGKEWHSRGAFPRAYAIKFKPEVTPDEVKLVEETPYDRKFRLRDEPGTMAVGKGTEPTDDGAMRYAVRYFQRANKSGYELIGRGPEPEWFNRLETAKAAVEATPKPGVPPAPFAKTWHELAMKRVLRWAAENGYDKVAWTTGEQQAERYDLSKQISSLRWLTQQVDRPQYGTLEAFDLNGRSVIDRQAKPEELPDIVGKEIADRLLSAEPERTPGNNLRRTLTGLDLKVGGEGMKGFYDRILPEFLNKYGKKWGARVGQIDMPGAGVQWGIKTVRGNQFIPFESEAAAANYAAVHSPRPQVVSREKTMPVQSIDITPAMKDSVLGEGQALFQPRAQYALRPGVPESARRQGERLLLDLEKPREVETVAEKLPRRGRLERGEEAGAGVRTLGLAIRDDLVNEGRVDVRGKFARTADDMATVGQVFRDPRIEKMRLVYVDDAGEIMATEAMTQRLPGSVSPFIPSEAPRYFFDIKDRMRRLGATGYWMMHNHPSTRPAASQADIDSTRRMAARVPGFKGHVIINSDSYGHIGTDFKDSINKIETDNALLAARLPHKMLGRTVLEPKAIVAVGKEMESPTDYVGLIYRDSNGRVRALQEMPLAEFMQPDGEQYIKGRQRAFGAVEAVAYQKQWSPEAWERAHRLVRFGTLLDAVGERGESHRERMSDYDLEVAKGTRARMDMERPLVRVEEERAPYGREEERPEYQVRDRRASRLVEPAAPTAPVVKPIAGRPPSKPPKPATARQTTPAPVGRGPLQDLDAMARAPEKSPVMERLRNAKERLIETQVNRFEPLRRLSEAMKEKGAAFEPGTAPIEIAEITKARAMGQSMIFGGALDRVIKDANKLGAAEDLNRYLTLAQFDKRIRDLAARPESGVTPEGRTAEGGYVNPRQFDKAKVDAGMAALRESLGERYGEVENLAKRVWNMNRDLLTEARDAGLISKESYDAIVARGEDYVPMQVLDYLDEVGRAARAGTQPLDVRYQDVVKRMEGTERDVRNTLASSYDKGLRAIGTINRNRAARAVGDLAGQLPGIVDEVPADKFKIPEDREVVSALYDGKRRNFAVTPEIKRAMDFLDADQIGLIGRVLSATKRPLQVGATGANLAFAIPNVWRDARTASVYSKYGVKGPLDLVRFGADWVQGLLSSYKKDELWKQAAKSGALFTFQKSISPEAFVRKSVGKNSVMDKLNVIKHVEQLNNHMEEATKLATFQRGLRAGAPIEDIAYEVANYGGSPNFGRAGSYGQTMNLLWMFYNARLQGAARNIRRIKETPSTAGKAALARIATTMVLPAMALWAWNQQWDGEQGMEDVPKGDLQRYHIILLPETYRSSTGEERRKYLKIPKEETEQWIAPMMTNFMDWMKGHDPDSAAEIAADTLGSMSPISFDVRGKPSVDKFLRAGASGILAGANPAVRLPVEVGTNYSGFQQGPLVPKSLAEHVRPTEQARPTTSRTIQEISKLLDKAPGMEALGVTSPIKLQHIVTSSTGGAGQSALDTSDMLLALAKKHLGGIESRPGTPETVPGWEKLGRQAFFSRFMGTGGNRVDRDTERRFYEALDAARRVRGSVKQIGKREGREAAEELKQSERPYERAAKKLEAMGRELGANYRKQIEVTYYSTASLDERERALVELAEKRHRLMERFREMESQTEGFTK